MTFKRNLFLVCLIILSFLSSACQKTSVDIDDDNKDDTNNVDKHKEFDKDKIRLLYTANLSKKLYVQSENMWVDGYPAYEPVEPFAYLATMFKKKRNEGIGSNSRKK